MYPQSMFRANILKNLNFQVKFSFFLQLKKKKDLCKLQGHVFVINSGLRNPYSFHICTQDHELIISSKNVKTVY